MSERTSPEVQYRVYCPAIYVVPVHIIWRKNIAVVVNSTSHTISHQLMDAATDNYINILTVSGEEHQTQNITCQAEYGPGLILASNQLIIEGFNDYYHPGLIYVIYIYVYILLYIILYFFHP